MWWCCGGLPGKVGLGGPGTYAVLARSHVNPCDYDLIPKMKEPMRGQRFQNLAELRKAAAWSLVRINRRHQADGIQRLPHRWRKTVRNLGDYIEGLE